MKLWKVVLAVSLLVWKTPGVKGSRSLVSWGQWSACSVSCGDGVQKRKQKCSYAPAACQTDPPLIFNSETRLCQPRSCPVPSSVQGFLQGNSNNVALKNHLIKEELVFSEIECALFCLRISECASINIGTDKRALEKNRTHALLTCQLNNSTDVLHPRDLIFKDGCKYYSIISRKLEEN